MREKKKIPPHAYITGVVAKEARERLRVSRKKLAEQINVTQQQIVAWESGGEYPTWEEAKALAQALRLPFGYLWLSKPPDKFSRLEER